MKSIIATLWMVFTVTLVSWWIYLFIHHGHEFPEGLGHMLFLEGTVLLALVMGGGLGLMFLTYQDERRHHQLRHFFAQFSHDLKTSITRLRLQSEILLENSDEKLKQQLNGFNESINRLDLQLENSLWMARIEDLKTHLQVISISQCISEIKSEFPDLKISLTKDAKIYVDHRFVITILRNLFHNSIQHGKASQMTILSRFPEEKKTEILIQDNAQFSGNHLSLGRSPIEDGSAGGSGMGLYLVRRLMLLQNGDIYFSRSAEGGLVCHLIFPQSKGQL